MSMSELYIGFNYYDLKMCDQLIHLFQSKLSLIWCNGLLPLLITNTSCVLVSFLILYINRRHLSQVHHGGKIIDYLRLKKNDFLYPFLADHRSFQIRHHQLRLSRIHGLRAPSLSFFLEV